MHEIFSPQENHILETALLALSHNDNRKTRDALYRALVRSTLFVPAPGLVPSKDCPPGNVSNFSGETIQEKESEKKPTLNPGIAKAKIPIFKNRKNETAIASFTSLTALASWKKDCQHYRLIRGDELLVSAFKHKVDLLFINMAGFEPHGFLTKTEIELLMDKVSKTEDTEQLSDGSREMSVDIKPPPCGLSPKLTDFLCLSLNYQPEISSAYLFEARYDDGEPHLVLGVEAKKDEEKIEKWLEALTPSVTTYLGPGEYIDFMVMDHEMAEKIKEIVPPIWPTYHP